MASRVTDNVELVRNFLSALAQLDVAALSDLVTEDLTWRVPGSLPISGLYNGKPAFVGDFLRGAAALFETGSLAFDIKHLLTNGDVVVAEYVGTGTSATSGQPYRNDYCVIFDFRGGKISAAREYLDTAHVADVLLALSPE